MGKECGNLGMEREEELNLELSIGYGKTENCKEEIGKLFRDNNVSENSRSNFAENECVDLQRRREIQALRRQEARRKREEKMKKSRGGQNGEFVEDKLLLEAQKLQGRVEERESRERDCVSEERGRKKCSNEVGGGELSLSLFTDNKTERRDCLASQYSFPSWADYDSERSNGVNDPGNGNTTSNRSLEQCSSAVSDYHSISHRGGSSSDTAGSHSSAMRSSSLHPNITRTVESHDSWSQPETNRALGVAKSSALSNPHSNLRKPENSFNQPNNTTETSGSLNDKSTTNENLNATASIPKMPCVSATGNGPNGRTVMGFLYRYTKTEVSIMCVCHGSSFSPAGFVEHAGGIDISQPLKHITIVPSG